MRCVQRWFEEAALVVRSPCPGFGPAVFLFSGVVLAAPGLAFAADNDGVPQSVQQGERRTTYSASFFAQFAPSTALDVVRRTPGFVLEQTQGDARGFAGTAGNVVVNGARPSSKSESLEAMLARIPARRVVRVEVAAGDLFGSDYAGKSQVLNVVLSAEGGVDGNVKLSLGRNSKGELTPNAEASVLLRRGKSSVNLSAATSREQQVEVGYDLITDSASHALRERRDKRNVIKPRQPSLALAFSHEESADSSEHANLRYAPSHFTLAQYNHVSPAGGTAHDDGLVQDYHPTAYEIGGDISRPLGGGAIKLVALGNRRERDDFDAYYGRTGAALTSGYEQTTKSRYDEVLGRLSWTQPKLLGMAAEIGTELAWNKLDNATELFLLGPGGARTRFNLPIGHAAVTELRSESYVNLGGQLTPNLRLDGSLAFEWSKLDVSGDTTASRSLKFWKPGLTLDWKGPKHWHVQALLRKRVAQLNFYDFISSAELANGRINGGNADLRPDRTWEAHLTLEHPVLGKGLVKLELGYDRVSDLQDRVLTPDGFDAPGNLGSGTRKHARLTFDAPLDSLGLKATRVKFNGGLQETSIFDPLSKTVRPWSGYYPSWDWSVELRRDLKHWSYGAAFNRNKMNCVYRIDEKDCFFNNRPYGSAFIEFRPEKRTTLRLDFDNVLDGAGQRFRQFYNPNRSAGLPVVDELRFRESHVAVTFSINRSFGGGS